MNPSNWECVEYHVNMAVKFEQNVVITVELFPRRQVANIKDSAMLVGLNWHNSTLRKWGCACEVS